MTLFIFADTILIQSLRSCGGCAAIASEEHDDIVYFEEELAKDAAYLIAFDPLDGSSNIDVNVSVGTIFSIYRHASEMSLFKITKTHNNKRVDERWLIKSTSGQILKRNKNLIHLLNFFKHKKLQIIK